MDLLQTQRRITVEQPLNQNLPKGQVERMFTFEPNFPTFAHYEVIPRELVISLTLSVLAVGLVSSLFLPHISGTLLSMLVIAAVDVELLGIIYAVGYTINSITFVLLIMAIGLVADYCLHMVHSFLHVDAQDRDARGKLSLLKIGGSVFLGGCSTFFGILALAWSRGEAFLTFFVMFVSMVVLGIFHGLVVLPVALSLVGPDFVVVSAKTGDSESSVRSSFVRSSSFMRSRSSTTLRSGRSFANVLKMIREENPSSRSAGDDAPASSEEDSEEGKASALEEGVAS